MRGVDEGGQTGQTGQAGEARGRAEAVPPGQTGSAPAPGHPAKGARRPRVYVVGVALLRPVWRSLPRTALGVSAALGMLLAGTSRMFSGAPDPWLCLNLLRAAALAFGLGLAFVLDDPARHTTAVVPTRRPLRTGLRFGLAAPLVALSWTAAWWLIPEEGRPPVGAVTLEAGALAALASAAGVVVLRLSEATEPGIAVSAGFVGTAFAATLLLPERWELFVPVNDPHWDDAHRRWAGVLLVAVLAGAFSLAEPLRRRRTVGTVVLGRR